MATAPCSRIATIGTRVVADLGKFAEEQPIFGHREIDPRCGQHALAEKTKGGDRDAERDQRRAVVTERQPHHVGRRRLGLRQPGRPKRIDADERDRRVEDHDAGNAHSRPGPDRGADCAFRRQRSSTSASRRRRTSPASSPRRSPQACRRSFMACRGWRARNRDWPERTTSRPAPTCAIATILSTIRPLCTVPPARTPRQLIATSNSKTADATMPSGSGKRGKLDEITGKSDRDRRHSA